ncbi:type II toxin-antitoxin system antitoxin SocA domain-containing protein [Rhizobium sp. R635]|uniref:Panacea domain-containing protein n=1 Tax=Rhizobium sp. R635 TaxID=1764275 RepID=UPI000B535B24|nr:type II toxin-antitoxin system antitoxin SocA domain-containing protein [Rhizobium sp. R635]
MAYSPIKVANAMIEEAQRDGGRALTPLQLIKLVYIAHGWAFVFLQEPLINEPVQAWQYGPVSPTLYYAVRGYRASPIATPIPGDADPQVLSGRARELIHAVYERYKHLSGTQLSGLTHMPNTPWSITWESRGRNGIIPNDLISTHYNQRFQEMSRTNG